MTNEEFQKAMVAAGFAVWNTGGGCSAWGFSRADGLDVIACQDLDHEWNPKLVQPDSDWMDYGVGLVDAEGQSINEAYRTFKDIRAAVDYAINLKGGEQ